MMRNFKSATLTLGLATALVLSGTVALAGEDLSNLYTLDTCPHCGHAITADSPSLVLDGRQLRFCSAGCVSKVEANPAKYLAKVDDMILAAQTKTYPLTTCIISGKALGDDPISRVFGNRLVQFCCENCPTSFGKDLANNTAKLDAAIVEAQLPSYSLKTCPVSGEELGTMGDPINLVAANRLIRFCCTGCIKTFKKEPAKFLAALGDPIAAKAAAAGHEEGSGKKL